MILSHADVTRLLTMPACIDVMADALRATSEGNAVLPLRSMVRTPDTGNPGILGLMPGYLGAPAAVGLQVEVLRLRGPLVRRGSGGGSRHRHQSHIGVQLREHVQALV